MPISGADLSQREDSMGGSRTSRAKFARRKRGRPARREDYVSATPETLAKLRPDPLLALFEAYGGGDRALERAADEIRAVYLAICGMLMAVGRTGSGPAARSGGRQGRSSAVAPRQIAPFLAWAHSETYLPWAQETSRRTLEALIDLVIERRVIHPDLAAPVARALGDYAARMRTRRRFKEAS
jgi:hypothetical protein